MKVIAFTGPKYSGKGTAGAVLHTMNQEFLDTLSPRTAELSYDLPFRFGLHTKMAAGVKRICAEMFGFTTEEMEDPSLKETVHSDWGFAPRDPMMDIANWLRDKYGGDIHAKRWNRLNADPEFKGAVAMDDLRFPDDELPMLRQHDCLVLYVQRDSAERSLLAAQASGDIRALNPSERHYLRLKEEADIILDNNGTIQHLHNQVLTAIKNRWGHWNYWGVE